MGIKTFIKKYCPESLLPLVRTPYRKIRARVIAKRALKYILYYQDELSRELLYDDLNFLKTNDNNIFMDRADKFGWNYTKIYAFMIAKYSKGVFDPENYSGFVILDCDDKNAVRYTCRLLSSYGLGDKYRILELSDFLKGSEIGASEFIVAAVSSKYHRKIKEYAGSRNMPNDIAHFIIGKHEEIQYLDVFSPVDDEIVIDAGAYDGKTALRFLKWGGSKIKRIYSFELDPANVPKCEANLKGHEDKVTLINKGTWSSAKTLRINSGQNSQSRIFDEGKTDAELAAIDDIVKDEKVTFIKMDVEGAELESLKGAKNTIIKNRPRLAVCVYHKPEDIYEIPEYILSIVPEYKFYLRRYDSHSGETVLYASVN